MNSDEKIFRNRIDWIDVAKGIAIILVVLGHSSNDLVEPVNRFLLSFHMPLFFFLSGICYKKSNIKVGRYVYKKFSTLLIPKMTLGLINLSFDILQNKIEGVKIDINLMGGVITYFVRNDWFLLVMFYVSIIFYFVDKLNYSKCAYRVYMIIINIVIIMAIDILKWKTIAFFEIIPMGLLFYTLGNFINIKGIFAILEKDKYGCLIFAIPVILILSYWNKPVAMYMNNYGNLLLFFICACIGILLVCILSIVLKNNILLQFFGRNSIIVYIVHYKIILILHCLGNVIVPSLKGHNSLYPMYWHYFLITIISMIPIIVICNKWFAFFFGKKILKK